MKILLITLFILSITTAGYAKEVFADKNLKEIQIVEIKDGKAYIKSPDGKTAEIAVGDSIGREAGKVTDIRSTFITVETGTTKTRIPAVFRFEK